MESVLLPAAHAISPEDHGGIAMIVAATTLVVISLFLAARMILKTPFRGALYADDYLAIAATVSRLSMKLPEPVTTLTAILKALAAVQSFILIGTVEHGFGKSSRIIEDTYLSANVIHKVGEHQLTAPKRFH